MSLIALKDPSLVADDTGIVSKILMIMYIYLGISRGLLHVVLSSLSGFIIYKNPPAVLTLNLIHQFMEHI